MGRLTTHVLDTANGRPAAGLALTLRRIDANGTAEVVLETTTNADGRCEGPLLEGGDFRRGRYELTFSVAGYFADQGQALDDVPFLDDVVLRFGVDDPTQHYHVPLLVSPFGYTTYRGS